MHNTKLIKASGLQNIFDICYTKVNKPQQGNQPNEWSFF